jgi:predicted dehydrogenase
MIQTALIGCGSMTRHHIRQMLQQQDTTQITVVCEPSPQNYDALTEIFTEAGLEPPPNEADLPTLLANHSLDAAFIITPHVYHHEQTVACLEAGLDVLLEKPMVMNAAEAVSLIGTRDRTSQLLVVAFNGSLSPEIRAAARMIQDGELGEILSISATIWQNWGMATERAWRQNPILSGGGFLFDTGAHMLNTVVDLAGEIVEVAAWLDHRGRPVETMAAVIGRLASGGLVTLHGCGETIRSCSSDIRVFGTQAILRTGAWGKFLEVQRDGEADFQAVTVPPSLGVWEQFLAVRDGSMENPSPPEVGLRMAKLYDAIQASAARNGEVVRI